MPWNPGSGPGWTGGYPGGPDDPSSWPLVINWDPTGAGFSPDDFWNYDGNQGLPAWMLNTTGYPPDYIDYDGVLADAQRALGYLNNPVQAILDALNYYNQNHALLVDPNSMEGQRQFLNAARKFAQDYGPLLDVLLRCNGLGRQTTGPATQFDKSGGWNQANRDFDSLNLRNVVDRGNGTRTGQLPDGRTVAVYRDSSGGPPTLDIQSGNKRGKIRYAQ